MPNRFQYRLRSFLLLLLVAACVFGGWRWWATHILADVRRAQLALQNLVDRNPGAFGYMEDDLNQIVVRTDSESRTYYYVGWVGIDAAKRTFTCVFTMAPDFDHAEFHTYDGVFAIEEDGRWTAKIVNVGMGT